MNIEEIREFCLSKPGVTEGFPFDDTTLVFKVMEKMFCLANLDGPTGLNLKNTPDKIAGMREKYPCILPGYHMNKNHWCVVMVDGPLPPGLLKTWITESYELVVKGLTIKMKNELKKMNNND